MGVSPWPCVEDMTCQTSMTSGCAIALVTDDGFFRSRNVSQLELNRLKLVTPLPHRILNQRRRIVSVMRAGGVARFRFIHDNAVVFGPR